MYQSKFHKDIFKKSDSNFLTYKKIIENESFYYFNHKKITIVEIKYSKNQLHHAKIVQLYLHSNVIVHYYKEINSINIERAHRGPG